MNNPKCPGCKFPLSQVMICEDYMSGCYCANCGFIFDDYLAEIFEFPKKEEKHDQRIN